MRPVTRMLMTVLLIAATPGWELASTAAPRRLEIRWPSPEFRTLQSAVDALDDGGTLVIAAGTYDIAEPVYVINKRHVTIVGAGCTDPLPGKGKKAKQETHLRGPRRDRFVDARDSVGLFNFIDAGGMVRALKGSGFDAVIVTRGAQAAPRSAEPAPRGAPTDGKPLAIQESCLQDSVRGILATAPSPLALLKVSIKNVLWNGMSVLNVPFMTTEELGIQGAENACVLYENASNVWFKNVAVTLCGTGGGLAAFNSTSFDISDSIFEVNQGPGISMIDSTFTIQNSTIGPLNHYVGIYADRSWGTISGSHIYNTFPGNGAFGDGIDAARSILSINNNVVEVNFRAGVATFGSHVQMHANQMKCNGFDLEAEVFDNLPPAFLDLGGNACGCPSANVECGAESTGLQPPAPVTNVP